jgi:YggT family protein
MTPSQSFFAHWYFHIPNLILAALTYTLIGRYILSLFLDSDRVIVRVFSTVTDPVLSVVGAITPRVVPSGLVVVFAIIWLLVARIVLFLTLVAFGFRPSLG